MPTSPKPRTSLYRFAASNAAGGGKGSRSRLRDLELRAEARQGVARRGEDAPVELDRDRAAVGEAARAGGEQTPIGAEAAGDRGHRLVRLRSEVGEPLGIGSRQVRQVRNDEVDLARNRLEQVALAHGDATGEAVSKDVLARDGDGGGADIGRPDAGLRCG